MMGRLEQDQAQLFYSFCLEEVVPDDHQVRAIASVLDLSWVYGELSPHYPALGRPSIDPVLMIRMLILGYAFGLRSERLLCREVRVNLAYRWFCGLSIEDKIPDHSVFSRARNERFGDNDVFRQVFEHVVEACISAGLVGGKEFAVDASLIAADANKQRSIPGSEWIKQRDPETASRAVKEYMATLDDAAFGAATKVTPTTTGRHFSIGQKRATVVVACSRHNAVQRRPSAKSRAVSTRKLATLPGRWPRRRRSSNHRATGSVSKGCLRT